MHLNISDPIIVAMGPDSRTAGWGPYQFPCLTVLPDGRIHYSFAVLEDSETAYGKEQGSRISDDMGKTWVPVSEKEVAPFVGMLLSNGDRICFASPKAIPVTEDMDFGAPAGHAKRKAQDCYRIENISRDICPDAWELIRIPNGSDQQESEIVKLNWPNRVHRVCRGSLIPPKVMGRLRQGPDGTLWMPHYDFGNDPKTNEFCGYLSNYLLRSTDFGHTWDLMHYLPFFEKDIPQDVPPEEAYNWEGYGENDITYAPDGSLVRLVRTNGHFSCHGPMYIVRSADGGETWSEPEYFDRLGVQPRLLTLKCGVTLATYGRPGLFLRATEDPSCQKWDHPIELIHSDHVPPVKGSVVATATCSYTDMIALDDRTALLAYSDFTIPDENGVPHKTMMARFITVEDDEQ